MTRPFLGACLYRATSRLKGYMPILLSPRALGIAEQLVTFEGQVDSSQRHYSGITIEGPRSRNRDISANLSPTTSHTIPVRIPPPRAASRTLSPVVKIPGPVGMVSNVRGLGINSLHTVSSSSTTAACCSLHFLAISNGSTSRRSVTVV